jgi:hypothetical protein
MMALPFSVVFAQVTAAPTVEAPTSAPTPSSAQPIRPVTPPSAPLPYAPAPTVQRLALSIAAGAFYNRIYAAQAYGGEGLVAFGASREGLGWEMALQYSHGRTEHGLDLDKGRASVVYELIFDRFRLGIGPTLGYLALERATGGRAMHGPFVGLEARASFDFARTSLYSAFFVTLDFKVEGGTWGPVLTLGFRGDVGTLGRSANQNTGPGRDRRASSPEAR